MCFAWISQLPYGMVRCKRQWVTIRTQDEALPADLHPAARAAAAAVSATTSAALWGSLEYTTDMGAIHPTRRPHHRRAGGADTGEEEADVDAMFMDRSSFHAIGTARARDRRGKTTHMYAVTVSGTVRCIGVQPEENCVGP